jgi:hypothetical protein
MNVDTTLFTFEPDTYSVKSFNVITGAKSSVRTHAPDCFAMNASWCTLSSAKLMIAPGVRKVK